MSYDYNIESPALAYPTIELVRFDPVAVAENTRSNLVCEVTGIERLDIIPLLILPIGTCPVRLGINVTVVPGTKVNMLFGTLDEYNCAFILIVVLINDRATVVLK